MALCQAAALINHVAATGAVDSGAMDQLAGSLLEDAPPHPEPARYAAGAAVLADFLRGELPDNQREVPSYMKAMLVLDRQLGRRPELEARLRHRLRRAADLRRDFGAGPGAVQAALAGAYLDSVGHLKASVRVTGALRQITNEANANLIRSAILGGMRAARQWRGAGGRWWQLRLARRRLLAELERVLRQDKGGQPARERNTNGAPGKG